MPPDPGGLSRQRDLLRRFGIRPVKRRGQNFLVDGNLARAIASAVVAEGDKVLELGAGAGALTSPLLATGAHVTAVEVDRRLCELLREIYTNEPRFRLLEADLLQLDWDTILQQVGPRPVVAGNLPYVLTSPILFALADRSDRLAAVVCMVQREVAQRLLAPVGGRDYGILSVLIGSRFRVELLHRAPPEVFWPRPDVQSAVVRLRPRGEDWTPPEWERLRRIVRCLFGQRRKTLGRLLRSVGGLPEGVAQALLEETGIDPTWRPERLTRRQWRRLARCWPDEEGGG